jgi:peptidyl-prolyl cis-trans isomerase SurA
MKAYCILLAVAVMVAAASGGHAQSGPGMVDGINAVIHDSVITYQEVATYVEPIAHEYARQFRGDPAGYNKKVTEAVKLGLDQLTDHQLILHQFQTDGYNLPESIIDQYVQEEVVSRYGDRATMTRTLQTNGVTYEKFREQMRDELIIHLLTEKNVSSALIISPHKIEEYYTANQDKYKVEDQVKLRMIILNTAGKDPARVHERGVEILAKINDGVPFADEATLESEGSQKREGGDWGWVHRGELMKELDDMAFTLKAGEKSPVIDTPDACYIMLVEEKKQTHFKPLTEVRDEIEQTLQSEEQTRLQKQWIDRLRKKTFVRVFLN